MHWTAKLLERITRRFRSIKAEPPEIEHARLGDTRHPPGIVTIGKGHFTGSVEVIRGVPHCPCPTHQRGDLPDHIMTVGALPPMRLKDGFLGTPVRIIGEAMTHGQHTHCVRLVMCRFPTGEEEPYVHVSETREGPNSGDRLVGLSTVVHALLNLGDMEIFQVEGREGPPALDADEVFVLRERCAAAERRRDELEKELAAERARGMGETLAPSPAREAVAAAVGVNPDEVEEQIRAAMLEIMKTTFTALLDEGTLTEAQMEKTFAKLAEVIARVSATAGERER